MSPPLSCSNCNLDVEEAALFCPHCGALFDEGFRCAEHPDEEADGVCILCSTPCCSDCGRWRNDRFLCGRHEDYELFGDRARVYGSTALLSAEYASRCLAEAGLHPLTSPPRARSAGAGPDPWSAEVKVLVPFNEVTEAERLLGDLALPPT